MRDDQLPMLFAQTEEEITAGEEAARVLKEANEARLTSMMADARSRMALELGGS